MPNLCLHLFLTSSGSLHVRAGAQPLLYEPLWQAARAIKSPNNPGHDTLYDEWLNFSPKDYDGILKPRIYGLGSGSDFTPFAQTVGISCAAATYVSLLESLHYYMGH